MDSATLCPALAEPQDIITTHNINSLALSTYERVPGTEVTVTCLSRSTHRLVGSNVLTCLENGRWNSSIPVCELVKSVTSTVLPGSTDAVRADYNTYYTILPYLAALIVLAVICVMLVVLLCYSFHILKKQRRKSPYAFFESTRSSTPSSSLQTDLWVEMASPHHYRSHELALSRDSMVQDLRYTPFNTDWSGY